MYHLAELAAPHDQRMSQSEKNVGSRSAPVKLIVILVPSRPSVLSDMVPVRRSSLVLSWYQICTVVVLTLQ